LAAIRSVSALLWEWITPDSWKRRS